MSSFSFEWRMVIIILILNISIRISNSTTSTFKYKMHSLNSSITKPDITKMVLCGTFIADQINSSYSNSNYYLFIMNDTINSVFINLCPGNCTSQFDSTFFLYHKNQTLLYFNVTSIVTNILSVGEYIIEVRGDQYAKYNKYYIEIQCSTNGSNLTQFHPLTCERIEKSNCGSRSAAFGMYLFVAACVLILVFFCYRYICNLSCYWECCVKNQSRNRVRSVPLVVNDPKYKIEELKEFNEELTEDIEYKKVQFDHETDVGYQLDEDCYHCCCPYLSCVKHSITKSIKSRKAIITDTHFYYKRDKFTYCCCCFRRWHNVNIQIVLNQIGNIDIDKLKNKLTIESKNKLAHNALDTKSTTLLLKLSPLSNGEKIRETLLTSVYNSPYFNDYCDDKYNSTNIKCQEQPCARFIFITPVTIFAMAIYFAVPDINAFNIWMDTILSYISFLNAFVLFISYLFLYYNRLKTSKTNTIPTRSYSLQFPPMTPNTYYISMLALCCMMVSSFHHCIFVTWNNVFDCETNSIIQWMLLLMWLYILNGWILIVASKAHKLIAFTLSLPSLLSILTYKSKLDEIYITELYSYVYCSLTIGEYLWFWVPFLFSQFHFMFLLFLVNKSSTTNYFAVSIGSVDGVFNHQLYNISHNRTKYKIIASICSSSYLLMNLIGIIPWIYPIIIIINCWCIFLLNPSSKWIYKYLCQCNNHWNCIQSKYNFKVNFEALFAMQLDNNHTNDIAVELRNTEEIKSNNIIHNVDCDIDEVDQIIEVLKHYQHIMERANVQELLVEYFDDKQHFLDLYTWFVDRHYNEQELKHICCILSSEQCNVSQCKHMLRDSRYQNSNTVVEEQEQKYDNHEKETYLFWIDILNNIHYRLYHSKSKFIKRRNGIFVDRNSVANQFKVEINDKFSIDLPDISISTDEILAKVNESKAKPTIQCEQIKAFEMFLYNEDFDSDAITYDIENNMKNSNIAQQNKNIFLMASQFLYNSKLMKYTFANGFKFYYWKTYQHNHKTKKYYIASKYLNIKDELLNNNIKLSSRSDSRIEIYKQALFKSKQYKKSNRVQSMKVIQPFGQKDPLQYGIDNDTSITIDHIISVVLYTQFTELCTKFRETFRKIYRNETLEQVKSRNAEVAVWSRLLRECVEYYGYRHFGDIIVSETSFFNPSYQTINKLSGPFYCGMDNQMVVSEVHMFLSGPTSTSRSEEVAMRFASDGGITLRLGNTETDINNHLRGFPCNWISCYCEEEEVIFDGGEFPIIIQSIILMETRKHYKELFNICFVLEAMINGSILNGHYINTLHKESKSYRRIINNLIKQNVYGIANKYDDYTNHTFDAFVKAKRTIKINLHEIDTNLWKISDFVLYPLVQTKVQHPNITKYHYNYHGELSIRCCCNKERVGWVITKDKIDTNNNLFKPMLLKIFSNVETIEIDTKQTDFIEYEVDLKHLLNALSQVNSQAINTLRTITIKAMNPSWISKKASIMSTIISTFHENNMKCEYKTVIDYYGDKIDFLVITILSDKILSMTKPHRSKKKKEQIVEILPDSSITQDEDVEQKDTEISSDSSITQNEVVEHKEHKLQEDVASIVDEKAEFKIIKTFEFSTEGYPHWTYTVMNPYTNKLCGLKAIHKEHKYLKPITQEIDILQQINNQFIVKLYKTWSFEGHSKAYFVYDECLNVTLFKVLRCIPFDDKVMHAPFNDKVIQFYSACVIEALEYLHSKDIIYRNLNPASLILDSRGYVKLSDFMFSEKSMSSTQSGTPNYLAPEIIRGEPYGKAVDWWALGILIYEMCVSFPPFISDNDFQTYKLILRCRIRYPGYCSIEIRDLIRGLLVVKPKKRTDVEKWIKRHYFYKNFNWIGLKSGSLSPPFDHDSLESFDFSGLEQYKKYMHLQLKINKNISSESWFSH
eukprot:126113_1